MAEGDGRGASIHFAVCVDRDGTFGDALRHEYAHAVFKCALLLGVSVLAQGGRWPETFLRAFAGGPGARRALSS